MIAVAAVAVDEVVAVAEVVAAVVVVVVVVVSPPFLEFPAKSCKILPRQGTEKSRFTVTIKSGKRVSNSVSETICRRNSGFRWNKSVSFQFEP